MKCKKARELMGAYLYGDLEPEDMREIRLHTQECEECRADLESRGHIVSSLSGEAPVLADNDRERIFRSVRAGDVKTAIWWLRPASAAALAALLLAGFAIGRHIGTGSNSPRSAIKSFAKKPSKAIVTITEAPSPNSQDENQQSGQRSAKSKSVSNMADYARRMAMPAITKTDRNNNADKRNQIVVDEPVQVVNPVEQRKAPESDSKTKLPKPTGLNDVQTSE